MIQSVLVTVRGPLETLYSIGCCPLPWHSAAGCPIANSHKLRVGGDEGGLEGSSDPATLLAAAAVQYSTIGSAMHKQQSSLFAAAASPLLHSFQSTSNKRIKLEGLSDPFFAAGNHWATSMKSVAISSLIAYNFRYCDTLLINSTKNQTIVISRIPEKSKSRLGILCIDRQT